MSGEDEPRSDGCLLHRFELDDAVVCLDQRTDRVRIANPVGAEIWYRWASGEPEEDIVDALVERFDAPRARLERDVRQCIADLERGGEFEIRPVPDYVPVRDEIPARALREATPIVLGLPGARFELRVENTFVARELEELFPLEPGYGPETERFAVDVFEERGRFPIVHDGSTLDTGLTPKDAVVKAFREMSGLAARRSPWSVIIHAAAVERNGCAVLMPAIGGSGKTTLTAHLAAHGYRVLNDDAVPLLFDDDRLRPVPNALSIKSGSWEVLAEDYPELASRRVHGDASLRIRYLPVGTGMACRTDVPCELVALPLYDASVDGGTFEPAARADVFRELIEGGCIMDRPLDPERLGRLVRWLARVPCGRLTYGELGAARSLVDEIVDRRCQPPGGAGGVKAAARFENSSPATTGDA